MSTMFCKQNKTKNQLGDWMQRLEMSSCIHSITKCVSRGFIGQQFHEAWKSRMQKAHLFIFKWLTSYGTGGYCIKHVLWHCVNVNKFLRYKENCMWWPVSENSFRWTVTVTKNIFGAFFLFKSYVEFFFKYPFFGHLYTSIYQSISVSSDPSFFCFQQVLSNDHLFICIWKKLKNHLNTLILRDYLVKV